MPEQRKHKHILVTGGAGFIGSNFMAYALEAFPDTHFINIDKLTYAGNPENMSAFMDHPRHTFIHGDICDSNLIQDLFAEYNFEGVIHFAAESHVDRSIAGPETFIETNVKGTFVLLEAVKEREKHHPAANPCRFLHISTDEVYGSLGDQGFFTEDTPYAPNSPYSASKAASDHLVRSYFHTYAIPTLITHCSNNYGPHQNDEKLIPTIIRNAVQGNDIPIYGTGTNVRDWLHVKDHCEAIRIVYEKGVPGETYVIGARNEMQNLEIARKLCAILDREYPRDGGSYSGQIKHVTDRLGHDYRYALDPTKIERELGWKPRIDFEVGLRKTVSWYLEKYKVKSL